MTVSLPTLPTTWDPDSVSGVSGQPVRDVEAPLFQLAPHSQKPAPGLARSWKYDATRTRLTITLRPKVEFSDGQPSRPRTSCSRSTSGSRALEHGSFYSARISGVAAHGSHAVVLTLKAPSSAMVDALTLTSSAIVPADFGGRSAADFDAHPVGAGPFAVSSTSASAIDLVPNKHFYEKSHPYLSHLVYQQVSDPGTAMSEMSSGDSELAEGVPPSDVASGHGHARVVTTPSQSTTLLTFSPTSALTKDVHLRKAVSLAIDRSALVTSVYAGKATVAHGLLPDAIRTDRAARLRLVHARRRARQE